MFKVVNLQFDEISDGNQSINDKLELIERAIVQLNLRDPKIFDLDTYGLIVAPEYFWGSKASLSAENFIYIEKALHYLANENKRILFIPGTISFINKEFEVYNIAPIIYHSYKGNGSNDLKMIYKPYCKVKPFHETTHRNQVFVPGKQTDFTYRWILDKNYQLAWSFSVEICLDHASDQSYTGILSSARANVYMLHPDLLARGEKQDFAVVVSNYCLNRKLTTIVKNPLNVVHSSTVFAHKCNGGLKYENVSTPVCCNDYHDPTVFKKSVTSNGDKIITFHGTRWYLTVHHIK